MGAIGALEDRTGIGRFELTRELGRGAQGAVFLARDRRLGRSVALKTLSVEGMDGADRAELVRMLLAEARIVSQLQHPNLVTLYDAGDEDGVPYLVFEYVAGNTLAQLLRDKGSLAPAQAAGIALGALRGVACAHARQVLHRDLKPGNVMLTPEGVPRVMDFGIACHAGGARPGDGTLAGTPSYMPPEYVTEGAYLPASDVYAMGIVLYEMLAGGPPTRGASVEETLKRIASGDLAAPSRANAQVDERLDALVLKALARRPEQRFADAREMADALAEYLAPEPADAAPGGAGTLEFLLRRMRHKSDFPALAGTISAINRVSVSEREPAAVMCNAILKDVALTGKLLKMVNSAYYGTLSGSVSTVSRAVALLGFDGVRDVATSLLLFEHLQNGAQAAALKEEIAASYLGGIVARELVHKLGVRNAEEAFICAMFHRLGRLLVSFYLNEEQQAIERMAQGRGWEPARCARHVLGMSYEALGMGVARSWNFPERIVESMRPLEAPVSGRPALEEDKLRVLAALSNEVCDAMRADTEEERAARLDALARRHGKGAGLTPRVLASVMQASLETLSRESALLGPAIAGSALLRQARQCAPQAAGGAQADPDKTVVLEADTATRILAQTRLPDAVPAEALPGGQPAPANRQAALAAGVQDITSTLVGSYELNDLLRIILETMYRGIGFKRVLLCVRDAARNALRARFGFGEDAEDVVRNGFAVPLEGARDVFFAATRQGADICIEDIDAEAIRRHVPEWYRKTLRARGVVLLPISIGGRTVALIYGDTDAPESLRFKAEELSLLKTLRNQAVLAMKQRS